MVSKLGRAWTTLGILRRTFGRWLPLFGLAGLTTLPHLPVSLGMLLDRLLYPRLGRTRVERPILIVGNPRTGSTFLHRFLVDHGLGAGMEVWQLLCPSLCLQAVLRPFVPLLEKVSPTRFHQAAAHQTSLGSVETDDAALLYRYFDGLALYGFFMAFDEQDRRDLVDPAVNDTSGRDFAWLEEAWRRNLVSRRSDRVIGKLFSAVPRVPSLIDHFSDGRVLYLARDPLSVFPSTASLVTGVLDGLFGFWSLPDEVRDRYLERLYLAQVELLRRFHDDWTSGRISPDQVLVVRFDRLMADFEGLMDEILDFVGHRADDELLAAIAARGDKQRAYKSGHEYDLARFGLDEARIRADCAFFYDTFLPPLEEVASTGTDP